MKLYRKYLMLFCLLMSLNILFFSYDVKTSDNSNETPINNEDHNINNENNNNNNENNNHNEHNNNNDNSKNNNKNSNDDHNNNNEKNNNDNNDNNNSNLTPTTKTILYYTKFRWYDNFRIGFGRQPFIDHGCPVTNCYATNNRSLLPNLSDFDAVVFHMPDMNWAAMPEERSPKQRYVMYLLESPLNDGSPYDKLKNFFNWTMTYRQDSDIPQPHGWMEHKDNPQIMPPVERPTWLPYNAQSCKPSKEAIERVAKKKKLVVWMHSNCHPYSEREHYGEELKKHIEIDVMGSCGPIKCDMPPHVWDKSHMDNCSRAINNEYKFYLAFENSFCKHYATEKLFVRLNQDIVPIVMGKADYSSMAPPHSYINILDYDSPKELAEYLLYLDQNHEEYLSYFWWKDHYRVQRNWHGAFCRLCSKLNDPAEPVKVYEDMSKWWKKSDCEFYGNYPWSKQLAENVSRPPTMKEFAQRIVGSFQA